MYVHASVRIAWQQQQWRCVKAEPAAFDSPKRANSLTLARILCVCAGQLYNCGCRRRRRRQQQWLEQTKLGASASRPQCEALFALARYCQRLLPLLRLLACRWVSKGVRACVRSLSWLASNTQPVTLRTATRCGRAHKKRASVLLTAQRMLHARCGGVAL